MNTVIAQSLLSFLHPCANSPKNQALPLHNSQASYSYGPLNILNEIDEHLLTHSSELYKLLTVKNIPQCSNKVMEFNSDLWDGMAQRIRQMLITNSSEHKINWNVKINSGPSKGAYGGMRPLKSIGNMLFLRGDGIYEKEQARFDEEIFGFGDVRSESSGLYTSEQELCQATGLRTYRDSQRLFGHEKNLCILSNNQGHTSSLERTLRKGTQMRMGRAFLHHYAKFGVDSDVFDQAFLKCEETLEAYQRLSVQ